MWLLGLGYFLFFFFFSLISTVNWQNKPQRVWLSLHINRQQSKYMSKQHILPMYSHPTNILPRYAEFLASNQNHRKVKWFSWSHTRDPWQRSPETQLSHCPVQWATGSQTAFLGYPPSASRLDIASHTIYLPSPVSLPADASPTALPSSCHKQKGG